MGRGFSTRQKRDSATTWHSSLCSTGWNISVRRHANFLNFQQVDHFFSTSWHYSAITTDTVMYQRSYSCRACGGNHPPPTGRRCPNIEGNDTQMATDNGNESPQFSEEESENSQEGSEAELVDNEAAGHEYVVSDQTDDVNPSDVAAQRHSELLQAVKGMADNMMHMQELFAHANFARQATPQPPPIPRGPIAPVSEADINQEGAGVPLPTQPAAGPASLRQDEELMARVTRRLVELGAQAAIPPPTEATSASTDRKPGKKSGQARTVEDTVLRDIDWPHLNVYRGPERRPVRFNDLNMQEFTHGFMVMVQNCKNNFNQDVMFDILRDMMEDALNYPWENVRNFYRILASYVEMDRLEWSDHGRIQALRRQYAQSTTVLSAGGASKSDKPKFTARSVATNARTCHAYQRAECQERGDHSGYLHACAYCVRQTGQAYPHAEKDCRRKINDGSKNERGGPPAPQ